MKRKFKRSLSSVMSFVISFASVCAYAYDIQYNGGESDFNLTGKAQKAGQIITVKIEKDGDIIFTRQTETTKSGNYAMTFSIAEPGEANITVSENGNTTQGKIYKSSVDEIGKVIGRLNSSENEADILNDTENFCNQILQIDKEEFNSLNTTGLFSQYLSQLRFESIADFKEKYNTGKFFALLEAGKDVQDVFEAFSKLEISDLLGNYNFTKIFEAYTQNGKKSVLSNLSGKKFTDVLSFRNAVFDKIAAFETDKMLTDAEKWNVVSENNDYINIDLKKYESAAKFNELKKQLFEHRVTSIQSLKDDLENIYTYLSSVNNTGGTSGGGGTGKISKATVDTSLAVTESAKPASFTDITDYEWARSAVYSLAASGIISGKSPGIFAPADYITRAEFTKIVVGAFGYSDMNATADFSDVKSDYWAYPYIASALKNKIITGISDDLFNPEGNITRQDMAVICYRTLKNSNFNQENGEIVEFKDKQEISEYALEAVETLRSIGIINGKDDNRFAPKELTTRAEAAKIIYSLTLIR